MGGKRQGKVPPPKGSRVAGNLKKGPCHHLETSGRRAGDKISCKPEGNHRDPLLPTKITGRSHGTDNTRTHFKPADTRHTQFNTRLQQGCGNGNGPATQERQHTGSPERKDNGPDTYTHTYTYEQSKRRIMGEMYSVRCMWFGQRATRSFRDPLEK